MWSGGQPVKYGVGMGGEAEKVADMEAVEAAAPEPAIEPLHVLDPISIEWLECLEIADGAHVAEIGNSSKSILGWLSAKVGGGEVVAAWSDGEAPDVKGLGNVKSKKADVAKKPLDEGTFDAVYARGILMSADNPDEVLNNVWESLKVGGRLLIEEFDCSVLRPVGSDENSIELVERWLAGLTPEGEAGPDLEIGSKLLNLVDCAGFDVERHEIRQNKAVGGDTLALFWKDMIPGAQQEIAGNLDKKAFGKLPTYLKDSSKRLAQLLADPEVAFYTPARHFVLGRKVAIDPKK